MVFRKPEQTKPLEDTENNDRVFVVHGRNEELRKSMFEFLRSIGLKPIEWSQAIQMTGETAPFIGDILDAAFKQAQAVVVLLNGDDEARLRSEYHSDTMPDYEKDLTPQARPNVIFEAGLALGRFPKRTIIVEVGDLRPFSDIAGRHTIRLNNSIKARQDLAQRLSLAGCPIDLTGTDWHLSGNFEIFNPNIERKVKNTTPKRAVTSKENKIQTYKVNGETIEVHPNQLQLLKSIGEHRWLFHFHYENLKIPKYLAQYFVDSLIDKKLVKVESKFSDPEDTIYKLTKAAIDLLIKIGTG